MASLAIALLLILPPLILWLLGLGRSNAKPGPKLPPGPRPIPIIGNLHMLGQLPHRSLAKLAQKYGPIMFLRLGQVPAIVVSSPQAAQLFLKEHDAVFANRPKMQVSHYYSYAAKGIALTPYGDYWRRVRKMCTLHLFTAAKVEGFEGLRRRETEAAVSGLRRAGVAREVVDLGERVGELIEEITLKMVVGKGKKEEMGFHLKTVIDEALVLAGAFNVADFVPYLSCLDLQVCSFNLRYFVSKGTTIILRG